MKPVLAKQREEWLARATCAIAMHWSKFDVQVPADVQLSCGFPGGGSPRRRIGECWPRQRSAKGVNQVFISPVLADPMRALDVLGHELLHAVDDCKSKHGRAFTRTSKAVGYSGGKHSAISTPSARAFFTGLAKGLGAYPHGAVTLPEKRSKESSGLHKFECADHGDVLYTTAKKVEEFGQPKCRQCGAEMLPVDREKKKVITTV